jgi:hypothetical protein
MLAPSPTITTLSHATGEASPPPLPFERDFELENAKPKRWPWVLFLGAAAAATALFFVYRPAGPLTAPKAASPPSASSEASPTVLLRIQSFPAGASVFDEKTGSALGMTPLQRSFPPANGTMGMILRLAGYKDKIIAVTLDGNSSTTVDLERMEADRVEAAPKPAAPHREPRKTGGARKPPQPQHDEEDEWRVH